MSLSGRGRPNQLSGGQLRSCPVDQSFSDPLLLLVELVEDLAVLDALESLALLDSFEPVDSFELDSLALDSWADESLEDDDESDSVDELGPLVDAFEERESVTYQPLPLNTMPTG